MRLMLPRAGSTGGALVVLLAVLVFCPALGGAFLRDDIQLLGTGSRLPSYSLASALSDNTWHTDRGAVYYRPAVFWSHRLDLALWGHDATGHHLTNLVGFAALVLALHELLLALGYGGRARLVALALFAVHPAHVDVIAWVSGRADLLATLGGVLGWLALVRRPTFPGALMAAAALLFACLAKEVGVCFLAAAALLPAPEEKPRRRAARLALALALPALLYAGLRLSSHPRPASSVGRPPQSALELAFVTTVNARLWGRYLATVVTGADYGPMAHDEVMARLAREAGGSAALADHLRAQPDLELAACALALLAFAPWLWRRARADARDRAAIALALSSLLIATNLTSTRVQILFAPRYLMPVLVGAAVLVAGALDRARSPRLAAALCGLLAVVFAANARDRIPTYANPRSFYEHAVIANPDSPQAHLRIATLYYTDGDYDTALATAERAWERLRDPALLELALESRLAKGDLATAVELAAAHRAVITDPETCALLAAAAAHLARWDLAREFADRAGNDPRAAAARAQALRVLSAPH